MSLAPVILFVYNRPEHTKNILNSLSKNKEALKTTLYIYADGIKEQCSIKDKTKINEVRAIIEAENRFKKIIIKIQNKNLGLAQSIIEGVTEIVNLHGKIIVLEDDLIVSPYFLHYMNDSLERYENSINVGQIGACNFFACGKNYPQTFFINMVDCWGWATWKDKWEKFNPNGQFLLEKIREKNLINKFNAHGALNLENMLIAQIEGKVSSWAVRWTAVCILNNWLILYPNLSMSQHIASENATHANINYLPPLCNTKHIYTTIEIKEEKSTTKAMIKGYSGVGNYYGKYIINWQKIKNLLKNLLIKQIN